MTYPTLMVHLELGRSNDGLLRITGDLAERFHSRVVGIATGQPIVYAAGDGYVVGDMIEQDIADVREKIRSVEAEFHHAFRGRNTALEWRSHLGYGPLVDYLALEARCADLILTCVPGQGGSVDPGALVLQAGRPVMAVPLSKKALKLDKAVICWRDTREARRAVVDAMELLKLAGAVDVVEVTVDDDMPACRARLQDVVAWLAAHGISAMPVATTADANDSAILASILNEREASFVVAGAYGHTRLHEWVLGGVTRDLWMHSEHCSLLSH